MQVYILSLLGGFLWGSLLPNPGRSKTKSGKKSYFFLCLRILLVFSLSLLTGFLSYESQAGLFILLPRLIGTSLGFFFSPLHFLAKRRRLYHLCQSFLFLFCIYICVVNVALNASLIPAFMRQLDAFEDLTRKNYAEQVQEDTLKDNHKTALSDMQLWYKDSTHYKLSAKSEDGYSMIAMLFPYGHEKEEAAAPPTSYENHNWVLLLHGYTGWKEAMYEFGMHYAERGYNLLCPDLRSSGESEGCFIGMGALDAKDMTVWISYILSVDPDARIVIHGQSMGAATSLILSGTNLPKNVKAIISDASYTDAYTMFGDKALSWFHLPPFPVVDTAAMLLQLRGGYHLSSASPINAVKNSTTPTLFIHGSSDAMISVSQCHLLYDACSAPKEIYIVEKAGHAQCQDRDPALFYETIFSFLSAYMD